MVCVPGFLWGDACAQNRRLHVPVFSLTGCCQIVLQRSRLLNMICFFFFSVPEDLSLEEREELLDIRRRKKELIDDIEVRKPFRVCF